MDILSSTEQVIRPHFLRRAWHLNKYYWCSSEKWPAAGLLTFLLLLAVSMTGLDIYIAYWNQQLYNAFQNYDAKAFPWLILYFIIYAAVYLTLAIIQFFIQNILQLRWRRWLTLYFSDKWTVHSRYYQLELQRHYSDNPDQRISEDVDRYTDMSQSLFLGLFSAVITLFSFIGMLWVISTTLSFNVAGHQIVIPHYMVWVAVIYSVVGNVIAHLIGRKLVPINYYKQRVEANLRFGLIRLRENSRAVAQMNGGETEQRNIANRFSDIWKVTRLLITYNKRLLGYSNIFGNIGSIFPLFAAAPLYLNKTITLGTLSQTAMAFSKVQSSLSWFVSSYGTLVEWRAVIERLDNFNAEMDELPLPDQRPGQSLTHDDTQPPAIAEMALYLPNGEQLFELDGCTFAKGEHTLIEAPTGTGKSLLFGALSNTWPFWKGNANVPNNSFFVPQTPYLPIGTLADVLAYPNTRQDYSDARLSEVIEAVGLAYLKHGLTETEHWARQLSPGEQQRISFARALLRAPEWLFLDEATAALNLKAEQMLYQLLLDRLPNTTLISIAHKNTLAHFHPRHIQLTNLRDM